MTGYTSNDILYREFTWQESFNTGNSRIRNISISDTSQCILEIIVFNQGNHLRYDWKFNDKAFLLISL